MSGDNIVKKKKKKAIFLIKPGARAAGKVKLFTSKRLCVVIY